MIAPISDTKITDTDLISIRILDRFIKLVEKALNSDNVSKNLLTCFNDLSRNKYILFKKKIFNQYIEGLNIIDKYNIYELSDKYK